MDFGLYLGAAVAGPTAGPDRIRTLTLAAETLGLHSVWVPDHIVIPMEVKSTYPYAAVGVGFDPLSQEVNYDVLATLPYLAGLTRRVRLGASVLVVPYRNPLLVAKWLASLDQLSGGRVLVGVGVGWLAEEFAALDQPHFAARGAVTDEYIEIWKAVWSQRTIRFSGRFYRFESILAGPKPLQTPTLPIHVGGHSPAALRRAARIGAGWQPTRLGPDEIAPLVETLRSLLAEHGRRPDDVLVSARVTLDFTDRPVPAGAPAWRLTGDTAAIVAACRRYEAAGVRLLIPSPPPDASEDVELRTIERLAREVRPEFVSSA